MNSAEHCVEKYCAEKFVIHLNFVYYNVFTIKVINQVFYLLFAINENIPYSIFNFGPYRIEI